KAHERGGKAHELDDLEQPQRPEVGMRDRPREQHRERSERRAQPGERPPARLAGGPAHDEQERRHPLHANGPEAHGVPGLEPAQEVRVREGREEPDQCSVDEQALTALSGHPMPFRAFKIWIAAGPSSTTKIAGKIRRTSGNSIFVGAFCARSSACCRRRFRISIARSRRTFPIETPSVSTWSTERTKERMAEVFARESMFSSAS